MSFNSNVARVEYIVTNTNSLDYSFNFQIYTDTDLLVYKVPANTLADDTLHKINLITNYTVTINGDTGGFIKLTANPILNDIIVIERNLPINRTVSYTANGGIYSDDLNTDQNYQTYLIADESLEASRSLQLPKSSTLVDNTITSPEGGAVLRWNETGTKVINDAVLGTQLDYVNEQLLLTEAARDEAVAASILAENSAIQADADVVYIDGRLDYVQPNGQTLETNLGTVTSDPVQTQLANAQTNADNAAISAANALVSETNAAISAASLISDLVPTNGSTNPVQSNGVFDSLALKTDKEPLTGAVYIGSYLTVDRPVLGVNDRVIGYNLDLMSFEGWNGTVWSSVGGGATGGGGDTVFNENEYNITTNYTIPSGKSAVSVGDASGNIYIADGVTVSLNTGSRWVIL